MQLLFTREELKFLTEILEQQASASVNQPKPIAYGLLDHIIAHDLRFAVDELEDLQDILNAYEHAFRARLADVPLEQKEAIAKKEELLERIMDKVTEACAMV